MGTLQRHRTATGHSSDWPERWVKPVGQRTRPAHPCPSGDRHAESPLSITTTTTTVAVAVVAGVDQFNVAVSVRVGVSAGVALGGGGGSGGGGGKISHQLKPHNLTSPQTLQQLRRLRKHTPPTEKVGLEIRRRLPEIERKASRPVSSPIRSKPLSCPENAAKSLATPIEKSDVESALVHSATPNPSPA